MRKATTTYVYTVRALDKKNNFVSDFNRDGYSNVFIAPPAISSIENIDGGVKIKWSKNSYVPNYRVYRKTKNTSWTRIGSTKNGSFTDTTATSGASYTYTIRALDKKDNFISYFNSGKGITYVKAPTITKIENTVTGSKLLGQSVVVRQSTECITLKTTVGNDLPQLHQQAIHTVSLPTVKSILTL